MTLVLKSKPFLEAHGVCIMRCSELCMFGKHYLYSAVVHATQHTHTHKHICFASTYENIPPRSPMLISSGSISEQKVSPGDSLPISRRKPLGLNDVYIFYVGS